MARTLTLAGYTRKAGRAAADTWAVFEGGRRLGMKARTEGQPREANPFREGTKRSLRQGGDRYRAAAMGWNAGWEEGA